MSVMQSSSRRPRRGPGLELARNFERLAVPRRGRQPAIADENGVVALPPPVPDPLSRVALGLDAGLLLLTALKRSMRSR
jgi:hypothetical protein